MTVSVLVVTPVEGFGELIRQTLEESGDYRVVLATEAAHAWQLAESTAYDLALLDSDMRDLSLRDLGSRLRSVVPGIRLVLIRPESGEQPEAANDLSPDGVLDKPFYAPDLPLVVETALKGASAPAEAPVQTESEPSRLHGSGEADLPPWLVDVNRAAQYLTRLSLESAAQAALITREDQIWAYAGELPQPAAHELAAAVADAWGHGEGADMARFVRLDATGGEFMLYATALSSDLLLSMAYDARTPFSEIRTQAGRLARALATEPNGEWLVPEEEPWQEIPESPREEPVDSDDAWMDEQVSIQPLLGDVPPPSPGGWSSPPPEEEPGALQVQAGDPRLEVTLDLEEEAGEGMAGESHERPIEPDLPPGREPNREAIELDIEPVRWEPDSVSGSPTENAPERRNRSLDLSSLHAHPPALYDLAYQCVLVPRLPGTRLEGGLTEVVETWLQKICVAFAWRLERIDLHPEALSWSVRTPPDTSPEVIIDTVRLISSQQIFAAHPSLVDDNPSGDFWAPGYLIVAGKQPLPTSTVLGFVRRTRAQQGLAGGA